MKTLKNCPWQKFSKKQKLSTASTTSSSSSSSSTCSGCSGSSTRSSAKTSTSSVRSSRTSLSNESFEQGVIRLLSEEDESLTEKASRLVSTQKNASTDRNASRREHEEMQVREGALFSLAISSFLLFGERPFWFY